MWAVSSIPSQASSWPPPFTTTTTNTKSPCSHGPVTVSAKPRRQSTSLNKNINNHFNHDGDDDDDDDDGLAQSVNTPISKNSKQLKSEEEIDSDVRSQEEGNDSSAEEKQLGVGGSDILWALQKAFAQKQHKVKQKQKKREEIPASNIKAEGGGDTGKRNGERDYVKNVKPLCIRSDWSKRLDDLETRLRELTNSSS